jgi:hypothetical protein
MIDINPDEGDAPLPDGAEAADAAVHLPQRLCTADAQMDCHDDVGDMGNDMEVD